MIDLWVPGRPKPAERPRLGRRRKAYTPQATLEAENTIATAVAHAYGTDPESPLFDGVPLVLTVDYSVDGQRITLRPAELTSPLLGDVDNYLKTTMDGLQKGGAFKNDKQVVEVWATKHPSDHDLETMRVTVPRA